jgi:aspartate dehydrogenase
MAGDLERLLRMSDLVIECASAKASYRIARQALKAGKNIMVMSVGGLVGHDQELAKLALRYRSRVYVPSGAIAGIDALKAAHMGRLNRVTLTTRKPPKSFKGVAYVEQRDLHLEKITKDTVLFRGPAEEAVKYFPQNINVAAVLSLAGFGAKRTQVIIIASPTAKGNVHEITIESAAGKVTTRTENVLHPDNPKTSFLAVLSAAATLRQILSPVQVGT